MVFALAGDSTINKCFAILQNPFFSLVIQKYAYYIKRLLSLFLGKRPFPPLDS